MMTITKDTPKEEIIERASRCKMCGNCCSVDSGYVIESDIPKLLEFFKVSEEEFKKKYLDKCEKFNKTIFKPKRVKGKKPYGRCVFLDNGKCSVHEVKPLFCRLVNCSKDCRDMMLWFDLNYIVDEHDPESIRQYALYLRHGPTIKGGELHEIVPDKKRLKKILDYEIIK